MRQLVTLEDEPQARAAGRAFAKQVFGRVRWTRLGSGSAIGSDESGVKLYESAAAGTPAAEGRYTVRAVRRVPASLAEVEVVLATAARYGALGVLLPGAYASGSLGTEFGEVRHATGEREHASVEFARLRPYAGILGMEHHVLLSYSLATVLQRKSSKKQSGGRSTGGVVAVPALLHLLRPVDFPALARKRPDFQRDYLSLNAFSITYIVQETSVPGFVDLEVLLACSDEELLPPGRASSAQRRGPSQKQRMWQDVLSLTQIMQLVDNYRASRRVATASAPAAADAAAEPTNPSASSNQPPSRPSRPQQQQQQRTARAATLPAAAARADMSITSQPAPSTASTGGCCICHKRFGPFRWKHHCEVCDRSACDRCLSVIANPAAARKKKRVCNNCLYGPSGLGVHATQQPPADPHAEDSRRSAVPVPAPGSSAIPAAGGDRRYSAPATRTTRVGSRAPPPVPEYDRSSKRYASRSRASSRASSVYSSDSEDDDEYVAPVRARRAQTVTIEEVQCRPVAERKRSFRMAPSYRASFSRTPRPPPSTEALENIRLTAHVAPERLNVHQLRTPAASYELDFDWLNIFPKAPVPKSDPARVYYLDTVLKLDPQSVVFLRHDASLEQLAHRVLDTATAWHGCSINVAGKRHVYCLINASAEMDASTGKPAVVVDDVMPREESASSYAVFHNAPFFVAELASDDRFRAHPLVTDHGATSFLSFPLYAAPLASASASASASTPSQAQCIGTLDLWTLGNATASSHVSHEWWGKMEALAREVGARVQELAKDSSLCLKPRAAKSYSVDSSCDSRNSTRRDDSFELDLFEGDGDGSSVGGSTPPGEDRATNSYFVKGRSHSRTSLADFQSFQSWRFSSHSVDNSDNESTTSSCSNSSRTSYTSRASSRYSAAELHSAIESLLHQANETSNMVYNTGVQV